MVAALSPADINYDETLSTLRCVLWGAWGGDGPFYARLRNVCVCVCVCVCECVCWGVFLQGVQGLCEARGSCSGVPGFSVPAPLWSTL
jgi:hypothetical protein